MAAAAFEETGCRYQWARTLVMMGGQDRRRGEEVLAGMGAIPMVWPPESAETVSPSPDGPR